MRQRRRLRRQLWHAPLTPFTTRVSRDMAGEKAKENKALVAQCAACEKVASVELMRGVMVRKNGRRTTVSVCEPCFAKGWRPPEAQA